MIQFTYSPPLLWLAGGALLILLLLGWSYHQARGRPKRPWQLTLIGLRLLAIAAVVICLLDPQWVEKITHQQKSRVAVLLDTSRSMSIGDVPGGRLNAARHWIQDRVMAAAPPGLTLSTYTVDEFLAPLSAMDSASPTGLVSALSDGLESLLSLPDQDPFSSVILVSDGIENARPTPERAAKYFRRKGIPIHTVTVGTTNDLEDVIIENIQVKRAVPNEAPTRLALSLRSPGFKNKTVPFQVRGPHRSLVAVQEVRLNGGAQKVEIEVTPRQKGFQIYEASIPHQAGEWQDSNNRRLFGLEVVDPTVRVIYMEGTPQQSGSPIPEWKYLKDALESDPHIKVKTLIRQVGNNGQFLNTLDTDPQTGEKVYPVEHPTHGFPRTLAGLLEYDVVIHSDIRKESFTSAQLINMARLVEEYGGGFIMIGGNSAFGKGGYHRTVLDKIIPVAMQQENDSQARPIKVLVPRAAYTHPIMDIGATREETEQIWTTKFPRLYGYNRVERAKPGAVALGFNPDYRGVFGMGLLLAVQEIGKGRSMAFTSDTTRTWGRDFETLWGEPIYEGRRLSEENCDSRYYRQFWVNAIRWLANGKLGRTNNAVTLELAKSYCFPGESVAARVKVRNAEMREIGNAQVTLVLASDARTNSPVQARYDASSRSYVANLHPGLAGSFTVTAVARHGGARLGEDRQLLVAEAADLEMAELRARPDFMARLARESGGQSFAAADLEMVTPEFAFAQVPPPRLEYRRQPYWDKAAWMLFILVLLGTEWALRRLRGLA